MSIGIYEIRNKKTNKRYIGQSVNIEARFIHHRSELRAGEHRAWKLQEDWDKYGEDTFEFKILKECPRIELNKIEQQYIKRYNSVDEGYNNDSGGSFGFNKSKETKLKVSENNGARVFTDDDVLYIEHNLLTGTTVKELAEKFECNECTIYDIARGRTYQRIDPDFPDKYHKYKAKQKKTARKRLKPLTYQEALNKIDELWKQIEEEGLD